MEKTYEPPSWAGKPETGLHLDVMKDNKLIQKLMIDEKKCYIFGRNPDLDELCLNHASCSRLHAALIYHKHLKRNFLIDLDSRYGTFIGKMKLEPNKPTQLPVDTQFRFGESTRYFILREKPVQLQISNPDNEDNDACTLPENELELSNLTEFNTAHNKRINLIKVNDTEPVRSNKRKKKSVVFKEEEDIINPEDIDPNIGKFRNLVQTSLIPNKRLKTDSSSNELSAKSLIDQKNYNNSFLSETLSLKLNFNFPNTAPDIKFDNVNEKNKPKNKPTTSFEDNKLKEKINIKKIYAKEAWPGRKPSMPV